MLVSVTNSHIPRYNLTEAGLGSHGDNTTILLLEENGPEGLCTLITQVNFLPFPILWRIAWVQHSKMQKCKD